MYTIPMIAILLAMLLVLFRAMIGETIYDKILAVNVFGTITVLFITVFGFLTGRPEFLDISLVYALINFIVTVAVLKFFEYRDMGKGAYDEEGSEI